MSLSVGDKVGRYEILAPLGTGGMGQVWKAHDPRLNRVVAIKTFRGATGTRFEREARAIAALSHPYICQIFDVGPSYLVLEFVEGAPLHGPLPAAEALTLALQIAAALETAHKRGILHRDLKPANILVTESGAKLLDFGLAKLTGDSDPAATWTSEGVVLGTASYMSPEQARGEPVDARSDLFSFGAVLYELLSGRRAFSGSSVLGIINAVVNADPPPLDSPAWGLVKRCLAKSPSQRFQTAAELKEALNAALAQLSSSPAAAAVSVTPSIAVLPFANMSGDPEQEFFSDGLTEEIINALVRVPGLRVIARTSSFAFKGQNADIRRIAETLGVGHILEGSVRRSGNRIRVAADLVTAADGSHLWAERFDRELTDIFEVQDEIAAAIAATLNMKLSAEIPPRHRRLPSRDAHEALLRAWYQTWQLTPESLTHAAQSFQQAIALDPHYALARAGYADHLFFLAHVGAGPPLELIPKARAEAMRALELDPELPEANATLALIASGYDRDWQEAERRYSRAMAGGAVSPWTRALCAADFLIPIGRVQEAVTQAQLAVQNDPLHLAARAIYIACLDAAGRLDDAEAQIRHTLVLDPNFSLTYHVAAAHHFVSGDFHQALVSAQKAYALTPASTYAAAAVAGLSQRMGDTARADELLDTMRRHERDDVAGAGMLVFCLYAGDIDGAAVWAEKTITGSGNVASALSDCTFKPLRLSPHWPKLARLLNLPA